MLGVGDCVADDGLEEGLEDAAGFFVDHYRGSQYCGTLEGDNDRGMGEGGRREGSEGGVGVGTGWGIGDGGSW